MTGKLYRAEIDQPIGYVDDFGNVYPVNYGFIPDIIAGDGEPQDVYIISEHVNQPLDYFKGELAAIIHRADDIEDKWVLTVAGEKLDRETIKEQTDFLESYFDSKIELL